MSIEGFIERMKTIQANLLDYLDDEYNTEANFKELKANLEKHIIPNASSELKLFFRFLITIANNHHRCDHFYDKIDCILRLFNSQLKAYSNSELFNIFESNKRILLFLVEEKLLKIDDYFVEKVCADDHRAAQYEDYFLPELKTFRDHYYSRYQRFKEKDNPEDFYFNRKNGENESYICKLIRNDSINEFIKFVTQQHLNLSSSITPSIFETNSLLIQHQESAYNKNFNSGYHDLEEPDFWLTLIDYAAFFGSIKIFKYLSLNGVGLKPSLWTYAVHSNNSELIHLLEDNNVEFEGNDSFRIAYEAMESHENAILNYIQENYIDNSKEDKNDFFIYVIKYYNFAYIQKELVNQSYFYYFCKYDYYLFVFIISKQNDFNINEKIILKD